MKQRPLRHEPLLWLFLTVVFISGAVITILSGVAANQGESPIVIIVAGCFLSVALIALRQSVKLFVGDATPAEESVVVSSGVGLGPSLGVLGELSATVKALQEGLAMLARRVEALETAGHGVELPEGRSREPGVTGLSALEADPGE
jgi:hypothetical protein